jgi:hypothetical protein
LDLQSDFLCASVDDEETTFSDSACIQDGGYDFASSFVLRSGSRHCCQDLRDLNKIGKRRSANSQGASMLSRAGIDGAARAKTSRMSDEAEKFEPFDRASFLWKFQQLSKMLVRSGQATTA